LLWKHVRPLSVEFIAMDGGHQCCAALMVGVYCVCSAMHSTAQHAKGANNVDSYLWTADAVLEKSAATGDNHLHLSPVQPPRQCHHSQYRKDIQMPDDALAADHGNCASSHYSNWSGAGTLIGRGLGLLGDTVIDLAIFANRQATLLKKFPPEDDHECPKNCDHANMYESLFRCIWYARPVPRSGLL
jgi:hypothetical protein